MVAPVIAAAGIGAAAELAGGLMSGSGARKANRMQMKMDHWNYLRQLNFAKHGIQWRVEDAKAAGLHPLFALGGAGASYTPSSSQIFNTKADLGQSLGRAAQALMPVFEREMHAAQLENLKSSTGKNVAESLYWSSEAARNRQESNSSKGVVQTIPFDSGRELKVRDLEHFYDSAAIQPATSVSRSSSHPYEAAIGAPGMKSYTTSVGELLLPEASSMSESLEAISESPLVMLPWVFRANVDRYGEVETLRKLRDVYVGSSKSPWEIGSELGNKARYRAREFYDFVRENVFSAPAQYRRK